ncbi:hypothetical protein DCC81_11985 [Chitinophaga parva]|uniref:Uncharacterized protein n=1 Tax=Chitinophaga parva TaxID=2169414 RepID=A0A2T7BFG5_9BACT|nr:hypothetical protein [Chitinophaga parva]PUZ25027.1 hypothetical protein DCC81_11985 [Chitinophaga parva]
MILHKDCMPIYRLWLDKPFCQPFVFPWELMLTDHFGCEQLTTATFTLKVEFLLDDDSPGTDITSSFAIALGLDADNKNVFVAQLKEYPENMPSSFRLQVTINNGDNVVYQQSTEAWAFVNDQCVTAWTMPSGDWGRVVAGRLVVNGIRYAVDATGAGLPDGLTFGVNSVRGEVSLGADAGFVYEIYGEDATGAEILFTNMGTVCGNDGRCTNTTVLLEGVFDCNAPDGRFTGSVLPLGDDFADDVRYRYMTRLKADLLELATGITRTISYNNRIQRTEWADKYQLISYQPLTTWQKNEVETILKGGRIFIQGVEYTFDNQTAFDREGIAGTTGWWLKLELSKFTGRKEYSCEVVCLTCLKPSLDAPIIQPVACDPITSLQATTAANEDGTVDLTINASNLTGATRFHIGYRVAGTTTYTYISPDPSTLPVTVPSLANDDYEIVVTKVMAESSCPPQTATSNATNLNPFDYLVVRYIWGTGAGRDLDTFTGFIDTGTAYDNDWVGYGQGDPKVPAGAADTAAYLYWASDNTQSGVEAVLMNLKQFVQDNVGVANEIHVRMNAVWYAQHLTGDVQVQLTTYLGGVMSRSGFDFVNTGGTQVDQVTLQANVSAQSTSANILNSTDVAIVKYNKNTKAATITLV